MVWFLATNDTNITTGGKDVKFVRLRAFFPIFVVETPAQMNNCAPLPVH
jgi:hypothetical protein